MYQYYQLGGQQKRGRGQETTLKKEAEYTGSEDEEAEGCGECA